MNVQNKFESYVQRCIDEAAGSDCRRNLILKKDHSERVRLEVLQLGSELGLDHGDLEIAEFMGLFHDIGRFEQYRKYGTFRDSDSEDHAELGLRIIGEMGFSDHLGHGDRDIILKAIKFHNKARLPGNLPEVQKVYAFVRLYIREKIAYNYAEAYS